MKSLRVFKKKEEWYPFILIEENGELVMVTEDPLVLYTVTRARKAAEQLRAVQDTPYMVWGISRNEPTKKVIEDYKKAIV